MYNNLPVMARIAEASPDIEMRVFRRDDNHDLMWEFLNQGKYMSIPVFAFFDKDFRELGRWIERPAAQSNFAAEVRAELEKSNLPDEERRAEYRRRSLEAFRERFKFETIGEIRELLSKGLG